MSYTQNQAGRFPVLVETERCTGHCCKRFYLPKSPDEIQQMYEDWLKFGQQGTRPHNDIDIIAPMLIYLEYSNVHTDGSIKPYKSHYYTCRNFDGQGCRIYDRRPAMCSDYPYNAPCIYKDCTMKLEPLHGCLEAPRKLEDCGEMTAAIEEVTAALSVEEPITDDMVVEVMSL